MAEAVCLRSEWSSRHDMGAGHPERPERVAAVERALEARGWLGMEVRDSGPAQRAALEAVHPASHLDALAALSAAGGGVIDADTAMNAASWRAVEHAAGGAVGLVDALLGPEGARTGCSVHRPPGHHAERERAMGFCFVGNAAVGARRARDAWGARRVCILDWDVHHGNGTQDLLWETDEVLVSSIHQWPLWPGTGAVAEEGVGAGAGWTVNLPVPPGAGDAVFGALVEHVWGPLVREVEPDLVLVCAGFDAHADDPLAGCAVTDAGFGAMAASVRRAAEAVGAPVGVVLEGGYDLGALARGMAATMEVLTADAVPDLPPAPMHPLAERARARLGGRWPVLGG